MRKLGRVRKSISGAEERLLERFSETELHILTIRVRTAKMEQTLNSIKTRLDKNAIQLKGQTWVWKPKEQKRTQARPQAQNKVFRNETEKKELGPFDITDRAFKLLDKQIKAGKRMMLTCTYGNEYLRKPALTSTGKHKVIKYKV
jgi:hypothetical protein